MRFPHSIRCGARAAMAGCLAFHLVSAIAADDRCLMTPRTISADGVHVTVTRNSYVDLSGTTSVLDSAVVRLTGVRVGPDTHYAEAGFAVTRYVASKQAWLSFAPSWDRSLVGIKGFTDDVSIWLTSSDGRFVDDSRLSFATGPAYDLVAAVIAHAPALVQAADFSVNAPATFDRAAVLQVLETIRTRLDVGAGASQGQLPRLGMTPAGRLRGAQLGSWLPWDDPNFSGWSHLCEFPAFGGNSLRMNVEAFSGGQPILPGQPLTERLAEHLNRFSTVVDWALQRNVHVILAINASVPWPAPAQNWPDDGRSLWRDRSAQDELVAAWESIARTYKGRPGLLFELMNEPFHFTPDDYAIAPTAWNALQVRLVAAIRNVDPERWIIVTPIWSDPNNLVDFALPTVDKVIVDVHPYAPHDFTNQNPPGSVDYPGVTRDGEYTSPKLWNKAALAENLQPAIDFGRRYGVRMMCGEFGVSSFAADDSRQRWVADMLDLCESNGFDYNYWSYGAGRDSSWGFEQTPFRRTVTDKLALNQFFMSGTPSGALNARSLAVTVRPPLVEVGAIRQLFVAAVLGSQWYFLSSAGWQAWSSGPYPAYDAVAMPAEITLQVLDGSLDLSGFVGTNVFVGYGINAADMEASGRYALVYTVQ